MINQVLRKLGQWSVVLRADAPPGVLAALQPFGHIAIVPGRVSPIERGDEMLTLARYVGIFRDREGSEKTTLAGVGMAAWLGDEDGKGPVIEYPGISLTGVTFAAAVRALLPSSGSVTEGTLHAGVAGTYTGSHSYETPRTGIDYICDTMGGDWRVNGDGTLDAGPASTLFRTTPTCVIVRKGAGYDQALKALPGDLSTTVSGKEITTRVVLIAQALAGGTADAAVVPWKDIHGNPVKLTRVVDEQDTTLSGNAGARAQSVLNLWENPRKSVRLSVDEFDVAGDFEPGDVVWVYDPDNGLYDSSVEVAFRGELLNPVAVRVLSLTWPVERGYTVGFRDGAGVWTDLTPWVEWESGGGGEVEVADSLSASITSSIGSVNTVPGSGGGAGDTAIPAVPTFGTFSTGTYQPSDGITLAAVTLAWTQPLNTDASTIVDGDHYDIRYRPTGSTEWQQSVVPWDNLTTTVYGLPLNTSHDWQIRAVDYASPINYGAWSASTVYVTAADTIAPSTPAPPTVAASLIAVQVTHELGKASGGTHNLELDLDHLEVHVGASSGFTPDASTLVGKLPANAGMILAGIPAVGSFEVSSTSTVYVKVIAVDRTGNRSAASSSESSTALLIDDGHFSSLTVSKLTAGTMSAAVILGGSIKTASSGARVEMDYLGVRAYDSSGNNTVDIDASTGSATITGKLQTGVSGRRIVVDPSGYSTIYFYDASGAYAWINSYASGVLELSSALSGTDRTRLLEYPTFGTFEHVDGSSSTVGGRVYVDGSSARIGSYGHAGATFNTDATIGGGGGTAYLWLPSSGASILSGSTVGIQAGSGIGIMGGGGRVDITLGNGGTNDHIISTTIYNTTNSAGANMFCPSSGWICRSTSSARYKQDIAPHPIDIQAVLKLEPKEWWDRGEVERNGGSTDGLPRHAGLIAEDVAAIPGMEWLVSYDDDGDPDAVEYGRLGVALIPVVRELWKRVVGAPPKHAGRTEYPDKPRRPPIQIQPVQPPPQPPMLARPEPEGDQNV